MKETMKKTKKPKYLYQLKISLNKIKPPIWRRFIVDPDIKLSDLHKIIQTVMGWTNSHLHHFYQGDMYYSLPDEDFEDYGIDYRKIKLNQLLFDVKQKLYYEYDFGDGWNHTIVLEKIVPANIYPVVPICIAGKRNCPPEDCGGPYGYQDLCTIISNPKHKEYEVMMEWLGGEYDPECFDIEYINEMLQMKHYGCITL